MCTVSWIRSPGADGYDLFFNRDERRDRGAELPVTREEAGGTAYLAPTDGDHGGTWLAVNEHGLTVGLLNAYVESRGPTPPAWRSRGLLVRELAGASDAGDVGERLADTELSSYPPFVLLAVGPGAPGRTYRWDGQEVEVQADADALRPLASSARDQPAAQRARRARYAELVAEHGTVDRALLERFTSDHGTGPSSLTPCMHRDDAETRSQCRVAVRPEMVELVHVPGPPCRTVPGPVRHLARRPGPIRA